MGSESGRADGSVHLRSSIDGPIQGRKANPLRTFAVINQKGGCGKTTTAINLAATMADLGRKTLLVDMDPQAHCALGLAVPESGIERSIGDALMPSGSVVDWQEIIWQVSEWLDLAPATTGLALTEHRLMPLRDRDLRLRRALDELPTRYEICVIDCPPSIGLLTFNSLRSAGEVIIPVETGYFALHGAIKQAATLQMLADRVDHEVAFYVLATMHDQSAVADGCIMRELRNHFGQRVLDIIIPYDKSLKHAASLGQPVGEYDPEGRVADDYRRLAEYLVGITPNPRCSADALATAVERATLDASAGPDMFSPALGAVPRGSQVSEASHAPVDPPPASENNRLADALKRARLLVGNRNSKPIIETCDQLRSHTVTPER